MQAPPAEAVAGINEQLNYQARLLDNTGAVVSDGTYNIEFKIYQDGTGCVSGGSSPCGGTLKWTETRTNANKVTVKNGYFSVQLGSVTAFGASVDWNQDALWLSVNIGGIAVSPTWDGEMTPFRRLSATPYALNAKQLGGLSASQFMQLAPAAVQVDSGTLSSIFLNKTGASGNILQLQKNGSDMLTLSNSGAVIFKNAVDSTTAFQVLNAAASQTALDVNTTNGRVGVNTSSPQSTLDVNGTLRLSGSVAENFTTPLGVNVPTKINIPIFDPGNFGQIVSIGIVSTASANDRVMTLFDPRPTSHQPTLGVVSVDENNMIGFSWEGTSTDAYVKTTSGNIGFRSNATDLMTLLAGGNVGIGIANPAAALHVNSAAAADLFRVTDATAAAVDVLKVADEGAITFQNRTNSTAAFRANNAAAVPQFVIDSTNSRVYIGNTTADSTGALLVLDTKNTAGDPTTAVNGSMYYNSSTQNFRCYENGSWLNCNGGLMNQDEFWVRAAAAAFQSNGIAAVTASGTLTANNQTNAVFVQGVTGAVAGNTAGFVSPTFNLTRRGYNTTCSVLVRSGAALPTGARVEVGLFSAAPANANDPGGNHIAFKYSTVAGDTGVGTGWRSSTRNGTTNTIAAANVGASANVAINTDYLLKFRVDSANNTVYMSVNGGTEDAVVATLPAATQDLGIAAQIITSDTAADTWNFGRFYCQQIGS